MEKLFEVEEKELHEQVKIEDKDIIFAIYKHTYSELLESMESDKVNYYADLLKRSFRIVVGVVGRCNDESIDCRLFLEWYFRLLKTDLITQATIASVMVQSYIDDLDDLIKVYKAKRDKENEKPVQKHI